MGHGGKRPGAGRPYGTSPHSPGLKKSPNGKYMKLDPAEKMARQLAKDLKYRKEHPGNRLDTLVPGVGADAAYKGVSMAEQAALKTIGPRWRVPKDAPEEVAQLADEALGAITDVMRQKVYFKQAKNVLSAATVVREEVCGPAVRKLDISGHMTYEDLVTASLDDSIDVTPEPPVLPAAPPSEEPSGQIED